MLSEQAISKLGELLSETFVDYVYNDPEIQDKLVQFMAECSLSYVYKKLGTEIDSDLAVEISCAIQENVLLVNDKAKD